MLPNWLYGKSKSKLASILGGGGGTPPDYNQVKAQVNQNTEDIALLDTSSQALTNQANDMNNVLGAKNLISFPYYHKNRESNGITWTVNSDGSISASGTATADALFILALNDDLSIYNNKILSGCPAGGAMWTKWALYISGQKDGQYINKEDIGSGVLVEDIPAGYSGGLYAKIINGQTVDFTFHPMLRLPAITDDTYVPYAKTNKELTDDVAIKSSEITVNTTNVDSENISRNSVSKSAGVKVLTLQAKPKADLAAGTTYELGTVPSDYLPTLSIGFVKEDVVTSGGLTALIEVSSGKLKLTPRVNNIPASGSFIVSVTYI